MRGERCDKHKITYIVNIGMIKQVLPSKQINRNVTSLPWSANLNPCHSPLVRVTLSQAIRVYNNFKV